MKKLGIAVALLVVLVIGLVVFWTTSIDQLVADTIESYGSEALGTRVSVGSVTIRLTEGKGTIEGLRIAQPDGFGSGDAVSFDEITLGIDAGSVVSADPMILTVVRVGRPTVSYVLNRDRRTNLGVLQENLAAYGDSSEVEETPTTAEGEPMRLRIDLLEVADGRVEADLSALGLGSASANLPSVRETGVGGKSGQPLGRIAQQLGTRFLTRTVTTVAQSTIGRRLNQLLDKGADGVRNMLDSLFPQE